MSFIKKMCLPNIEMAQERRSTISLLAPRCTPWVLRTIIAAPELPWTPPLGWKQFCESTESIMHTNH